MGVYFQAQEVEPDEHLSVLYSSCVREFNWRSVVVRSVDEPTDANPMWKLDEVHGHAFEVFPSAHVESDYYPHRVILCASLGKASQDVKDRIAAWKAAHKKALGELRQEMVRPLLNDGKGGKGKRGKASKAGKRQLTLR